MEVGPGSDNFIDPESDFVTFLKIVFRFTINFELNRQNLNHYKYRVLSPGAKCKDVGVLEEALIEVYQKTEMRNFLSKSVIKCKIIFIK